MYIRLTCPRFAAGHEGSRKFPQTTLDAWMYVYRRQQTERFSGDTANKLPTKELYR